MIQNSQLNEEQSGLELCTFDDDLPHLTEAELREKQDSFEWYYFDIDTGKTQITVRYIIKDTSIHETKPAITFELRQEQKEVTKRIKNYSLDEYKEPVEMENDEGVIIEIGTNKLEIYRDHENNIKKYLLMLKFEEIELTLECTPMHRGFKVAGNRSYVNQESNDDIYSCAAFPAPRMKGEGTLKLGNDYEIKISGEGYHDHPWGTTSLMYSHKEWHWGRIFTDEFTVFFTKVIPSEGYYGKLEVLYFAKTDTTIPTLEDDIEIIPENWAMKILGIALPPTIRFPKKLSIRSLKGSLSLTTTFEEILIIIKVYIRTKVEAKFIENDLSGTGWVEYLKIPSARFLQKTFMFFTRKEYNSYKWRKKQDYEHLLFRD
jgi:hypothetical protein